jgi:hypothetical protein
LGNVGSQIVDSGSASRIYAQQKLQAHGKGVGDIFSLNYQKSEPKRDPLTTHDINGGVKRNQYGAKVTLDQNLQSKPAGGQIAKHDKYGSNYDRHIPDITSKNRS